jgi:hypothetical protein
VNNKQIKNNKLLITGLNCSNSWVNLYETQLTTATQKIKGKVRRHFVMSGTLIMSAVKLEGKKKKKN